MIYDGFPERNAWLEIETTDIVHNLQEIRRILRPGVEFMPVIKCNGYGLGQRMLAKVCVENGSRRLVTALLSEAMDLRASGITVPILVFAYLPPAFAPTVVKNDIIQSVYDEQAAIALSEEAARQGKTAVIHIKLETGLGRVGFAANPESVKTIGRIMALPNLFVEGIYSHFATADGPDLDYAYRQLTVFDDFLTALRRAGLEIPCPHIANSAAVVMMPESHYGLTRGAALPCGAYPSEYVSRDKIHLRFAMSWKGRVGFVKQVPAGYSVGYGCTFTTQRPSVLASLGVGYGDGYLRALSNKGMVLIHGQRARIAGAVCMDQMVVDVTDIPGVCPGDEVVFYGRQGDAQLRVEELAELAGTVHHELFAPLHTRIPRFYLQNGREMEPGKQIPVTSFGRPFPQPQQEGLAAYYGF
ncbi:MAG: alanine racemase [Firmicutes bacterium]|nr:alanine racemase [Bacillota bacterium]